MKGADAQLEALRRRFHARARTDSASILVALKERDREKLLYLAHGLAGIAGIFGHAEIGAQAAAVEEGLEAGLDEAGLAHRALALVAALEQVGQPGP
ncbi:MAG TPA: hypothetical protein VJ762_14700 [Sphingobium sp.]|nr:hypothetical protein [Sphingobium sp.]